MITYRRCYTEDDLTYVNGPRGSVMVHHNGSNYSITGYDQLRRQWCKPLVDHVDEFLSALKRAEEFVK